MKDWLSQISPMPSKGPASFPAKSLSDSMQTSVGWVEPKRYIYDHELVLIRRGCYKIEIEDVSYLCRENQFIIIPPNRAHTTLCLEAGIRDYAHFDWVYRQVEVDTPVMTFYPAEPQAGFIRAAPTFIPDQIIHGNIVSSPTIYGLMDRLKRMLGEESSHEHLAARGVLMEILLRLLDPRVSATISTHHQGFLASRVRSQLDQVMTSCSANFSVCECLEELGYSYEHLCRIFRNQYGLTPNEYVQSIRIERAKDLLRQTDWIVVTIADHVGYADSVYFSRLFKRYTGVSPGKYRSQMCPL